VNPTRLFNRRNALRLIAAGATGSLANGFWIEPARLTITRRDIPCQNLPPGLDGMRIGLLADIHFRPDDDAELLEKAVAQIQREKLDLIALAGDYMSNDPKVLGPMLSCLEKLKAAHGVFGVMGNHDGWSGNATAIKQQFEKAGISFLINQHSLLTVRGESLAIAGTDFVWLGKPDPVRTLKGISAKTPVLALVHEPDYFDTMSAQRDILLQVSGHSHGGQCRIPVLDIPPKTVKYGKKYVYGAYEKGDSSLFVTRGVGTTGPRVRFACPPELAILTLRGKIA
jgi:uncharacterized protein